MAEARGMILSAAPLRYDLVRNTRDDALTSEHIRALGRAIPIAIPSSAYYVGLLLP